MNESDYKQLVRDRDRYIGLLKGPLQSNHKQWLESRLVETRKALSDAHREQHNKTKNEQERWIGKEQFAE